MSKEPASGERPRDHTCCPDNLASPHTAGSGPLSPQMSLHCSNPQGWKSTGVQYSPALSTQKGALFQGGPFLPLTVLSDTSTLNSSFSSYSSWTRCGWEAVTCISPKSVSLLSSHRPRAPGAHTVGAPVKFYWWWKRSLMRKFPRVETAKYKEFTLYIKNFFQKVGRLR